MTAYDLVVRAARAVTPSGERGASLGVTDGRIAAVEPLSASLAGTQVLELRDDEVLLPVRGTRAGSGRNIPRLTRTRP